MRAVRVALAAAAVMLMLVGTGNAQQGMPDLRQMSGVPLPVSDIAAGTVTVRVIRGSLANVVAGQDVQLVVAGAPRSSKTNEAGRAEFVGLTPGTRVKATAVVDGERLDSQEFDVPAAGGVRLMLVAAAPGGAAPTPAPAPEGPAQAGTVSLGDQSRFVFEMGDESLTGFYILQVVNQAAAPVQPSQPLTIPLPEGVVTGATIMQGSSTQATIEGQSVVVAGPFAPGQTQVQVAFSVPYDTGDVTIVQRLPVPLALVTLLVEKVGDMQVESAQVAQHREVKAQADTYILGQGPGLKAGDTLTVHVSGLPHRPLWPRNLALALAGLVLAAGIGFSIRPGQAANAEAARRQKLSAKRERLFGDLASIEEQRRTGSIDEARYAARRGDLMSALERIYAELDEDAAV